MLQPNSAEDMEEAREKYAGLVLFEFFGFGTRNAILGSLCYFA